MDNLFDMEEGWYWKTLNKNPTFEPNKHSFTVYFLKMTENEIVEYNAKQKAESENMEKKI